jgi:hypothetical protein
LLSISWSFWALIIVAAYTANMACFLLTRNVIPTDIDSLDQVVRDGKSICLWGKTNVDDYMKEIYAEYAVNTTGNVFRDYFGDNEVLEGLINDDCDVALAGKTALEIFQRNTTTGDTCGLQSGRIVKENLSGFVTKLDTGKFCTSLIQYVIDLHLHEMSDDGFLDSVWVDVLDKLGPNECGEDNVVTSEEVSVPLTMRDMYGIFALHGFCLIFSVLLAFVNGWTNRRDTIAKSICKDFFKFSSRPGLNNSRDGGRRGSMWSENAGFLYDSFASDAPSTLRRRKSRRSSMASADCEGSSLNRSMVVDKDGAQVEDVKRSSLVYQQSTVMSSGQEHSESGTQEGTISRFSSAPKKKSRRVRFCRV